MTTLAQGMFSITSVMEGYTALLSNDSVSIATDKDGNNPILNRVSTTATLALGATAVTAYIPTAPASFTCSGCTVAVSGTTVTLATATADTGYVDIPVYSNSARTSEYLVVTKRFSFSKSKQGNTGYTPIKGVDYFDGVKGAAGKSSYLWVMYSQNADGNPMVDSPTNAKYIGIATTEINTKPESYSSYKWALVKGSDGINGESGIDGQSSYLHIKYSNDGGITFTANNGEAVGEWIGTYIDFIKGDSSIVSKYTWNKVKGDKGDVGPQGVSITKVDVMYYLSTSSTVLAGGTWATLAPDWIDGRFMWSKTVTTYSYGNPTESEPACVTGQKGSTGSTGKGVTSITEEYAISTSKATVPGDASFSTTRPIWTAGSYIWTRSKIVYNNPTSTVYTAKIVSSEWEAINEIEVGGKNLILNSAMAKDSAGWVFGAGTTRDTTFLNNGINTFNFNISGETSDRWHITRPSVINGIVGQQYTASCEAYVPLANGLDGVASLEVIYFDSARTRIGSKAVHVDKAIANSWQKLVATSTAPAGTVTIEVWMWCQRNGHFWMSHPKLEKGNKATDWSPAPEDVDNAITDAVDDIAIGGRNLLLSSNNISKHWVNSSSIMTQNGNVIRGKSNGTTNPSWTRIWNTSTKDIVFDTTSKYTLSFKIRANANWNSSYGIYALEGVEFVLHPTTLPVTTEWKEVVRTFTPSRSSGESKVIVLQFYTGVGTAGDTTNWIEIQDVKLEKGNKPTDWSPAPEDVATDIAAANTAAANAQTAASSALSKISDISLDNILAPSEKLSVRKEWEMIVGEKASLISQADLFKVSRVDYNNKFVALGTYLNAGATYSSGIPSWIADDNLSKNTPIAGGAFRTTFTNYYNAKVTLLNAIAAATKTYAENIQIGGRNLLRNGANFKNTNHWTHMPGSIDTVNTYLGGNTIKAAGGQTLSHQTIRLKPNTYYVWSYVAKATVATFIGVENTPVHMQIWTDENPSNNHQEISTGDFKATISKDEWSNCYRVFKTPNSATWVYMIPYVHGFGANAVNFTNFQVEEGNKPTDWSPAPEDVSGEITGAVDAIEAGGVNLLIQKSITRGKYLNNAGNVHDDGDWFYSDYIPVSNIKNLTTSGYTNLGISPSACYYDSNKAFVKGISNNNQSLAKLMTIDSNIKYIRFSGMIKDLPTLKIEKGTKATSWSPAPEDVSGEITDAVNGVQIGGRNLLLSSNDISKHWVNSSSIMTQEGNVIRGVSNGVTIPSWPRIYNTSVRGIVFDTSSEYTISFKVRGNSNVSRDFGIVDLSGNDYVLMAVMSVTTEWKQIVRTFTPLRSGSELYDINLQFYTGEGRTGDTTNWIELQDIKLEKGNKATDWTPAPEDIDSAIDNIQIGGRNLLKSSDFTNNKDWILYNNDDYSAGIFGCSASDYRRDLQDKQIHIWGKCSGTEQGNANFYQELSADIVAQLRWGATLIYGQNASQSSNVGVTLKLQGWDSASKSLFFKEFKVGKPITLEPFANVRRIRLTVHVYALNTTKDSVFLLYIDNCKLETGNKVTDWSPSPEDAMAEITTIKQETTANAITTKISQAITGGSSTITTAKFTMDITGLHIRNGGFDITNNLNRKVLSLDTAGNIRLEGSVYNYDSNGTLRVSINDTNLRFYSEAGANLGFMGTNYIEGQPNTKGLVINLAPEGQYIQFGYKANPTATIYTSALRFMRGEGWRTSEIFTLSSAAQLRVFCDANWNNCTISNANLENVRVNNLAAYTGYVNVMSSPAITKTLQIIGGIIADVY